MLSWAARRRTLSLATILAISIVRATTAHAGSVTLAWDANSEADLAGYVVSFGSQPGVYTATVDVGSDTYWSTVALGNGSTYYFAVQAYNTAGQFSGYSNEVSVTTEAPLPAPTVTTVAPASGSVDGGTTIVITGTNFRAGATVIIGSKPAVSTVIVNDTTINAVTPSGVEGAADVRVTNGDGQSAALTGAFTYISTLLRITSITPASGLASGGTSFTITGANFATGATVTMGGLAATVIKLVNGTTITGVTPAHAAGAVDVTVRLPDSRNGTLAGAFTYVNGKPSLTGAKPSRGAKRGGTAVTLTGTNFAAGAAVTFDGVLSPSVTVVSTTTIVAVTPSDKTPTAPGAHAVNVAVKNLDNQSATLVGGFVYDLIAPTVSGVSPSSGPPEGGTQVTITGTDFASGASVVFGGTTATTVTFVDPTRLTATAPAHAAGVVDVMVRNVDNLQGVLQASYTYVGMDPTADTDKDGLPDVWESRWGLNPNDATGENGASGDPDHDGKTNLQEYKDNTHPRGFVTRYFAEGVSSTFFTTVFAFLNPGDTRARVLLLFMRPTGSIYAQPMEIAPNARVTLDARTVPAIATVAFSTKVESDQLIIVDRTMSWDVTDNYGAHAETAVESPSTVWYLAEGATHSGFDLFYLIQNPTNTSANVSVKYLLPSGPPLTKSYTVAARSRFNIWVDLESTRLAQTDVSAVITSTNGVPIIVERSMYLNTAGKVFGAGHNSAGVTAPATKWFLAEGATGNFFDEFILIANPTSTAAQVLASFLLPSGNVIEKRYTVGASSRFNIWVDADDPALVSTAVSATIESVNNVPIIVERTMWWPGPTAAQWAEAHNSPGVTTTASRWALAEGEEGGPQKRATFILIANTSSFLGTARVTLSFEDGGSTTKLFPLLPNSRFNVAIGSEFPEAVGHKFGAVIESIGDTEAELVVERAMYWDANGQFWAAGTNAVATRLP